MSPQPPRPEPGRQHRWTMLAFGLVGLIYVVVVILGMRQN